MERSNGHLPSENGHVAMGSPRYPRMSMNGSLPWLDLRVFYVRVSKCEIDDSTPEFLTLNHIPLDRNTLLEVNGARTSVYSDGASTLLRRDRLDKKSEEATFVSTDSIKMTGSVKFEVLEKEILLLSGILELSTCTGETRNHGQKWNINFDSDVTVGTSFLKARQHTGVESGPPTIEVYVAGSFLESPIIFTKILQLGSRKKQTRIGRLDSIPEYEATEGQKDAPSMLDLEQASDYSIHKPESEEYDNLYPTAEYLEMEDGELSWFNAGVRVGVGIGLSVCLGIGIGVGLLVRTYQGTTRNFRRRLL